MKSLELRDPDAARGFLATGLWLQRVAPPAAVSVRPALEYALEMAAAGHPLPPVGFLADLGHIVFDLGRDPRPGGDLSAVAGLRAGLIRAYEDFVLGKFFTDWTFERAGDVLRHLRGRDRPRGLAFTAHQFLDRADCEGVVLSPALVKALLEQPPEEVLARGWDQLVRDGVAPVLARLYESLIAAARRVSEVLAPEDVFELEHGTALAELGQRVALRQVLQSARRFEDTLPARRVRPLSGRREVPTRVLDEDTYPVGGFSSIANRGSVESLLHSQLAYMEPAAAGERPDLFDVKFLRDELLYYSRDENQFLRRRRSFLVVLAPDLIHARFKDVDLPNQRIVLTLALLVAAVRRLTDWLSADALTFEFMFVAETGQQLLTQERDLLAMVLREAVANGAVRLAEAGNLGAAGARGRELARRSLCHVLVVGVQPPALAAEGAVVSQLSVAGPRPVFSASGQKDEGDVEDALAAWDAVLERLLRVWV